MNDLSPAVRRHVVTWEDPVPVVEGGLLARDGIDYLRAVLRGELPSPPMARLLDFRLETVEEGRVVFVCEPREFHYSPVGTVHGGLAATLIDSATGCAVHSTLKMGTRWTTVDLISHFIRPMRAGMGLVRCEGRTVHVGGSLGTAEARVTAADGALIAYGHATIRLFRSD